jgi:hypothetical protein
MRKFLSVVVVLAHLFFSHIQWAGANETSRLALSETESARDDTIADDHGNSTHRELWGKRVNADTANAIETAGNAVKFYQTNSASLSSASAENPSLNHITSGSSSYRLSVEVEVDGRKNIEDVWFEVSQYESSSRSPYDVYQALQDGSDPNVYYADILNLEAGTYNWRIRVHVASSRRRRRGHAYEYSPQYTLVVAGTC